jgi:replicative DNA helicase
MSLDLLSIMSNRDNYFRFQRFIKQGIIAPEAYQIIKDLEDYYASSPTIEEVDWEAFEEWFRIVQHPAYKSDKMENYATVFKRLLVHSLSDSSESIVEKLVSQDYCAQIADISLRGAEGDNIDLADITSLLDAYDIESDRVSNVESWFVMEDIGELIEDVVEGGLEWRMKFLNESIGNLRQGKLMCFAARPNTGKTTLLASEATFIAPQLEDDEYVIWFNNEEEGKDVKFRIVQAALGLTSDQIRTDPVKAHKMYESLVGHKDKILVVNKADLSTKDMEEVLRTKKAGLIIVDQLWKVQGFDKESSTDTSRIGSVFQWARELSKKHAPLITVHQVKTEGEGVEYLTPSMLYMSGTVIQGEVDTLVMMGRNYIPGMQDNRYLSIAKNKGAYGPHVKTELREGKAEILIEPEIARFVE